MNRSFFSHIVGFAFVVLGVLASVASSGGDSSGDGDGDCTLIGETEMCAEDLIFGECPEQETVIPRGNGAGMMTFDVDGPGGAQSAEYDLTELDYLRGELTFKLDVDEEENGCVSALRLQLTLGRDPSLSQWTETVDTCELFLDFETNDANQARLVRGEINANSFCPGFNDDNEGFLELETAMDTWVKGPTHVAEAEGAAFCQLEAFQLPEGPLELTGEDGRVLRIGFDQAVVGGPFTGIGDTEARCPALSE